MSLAYTTAYSDRVMGLVCLSGGHFSNDINRYSLDILLSSSPFFLMN